MVTFRHQRGQYECETYFGGRAPAEPFYNDLFCSGTPTTPACDMRWYPDEIAAAGLVVVGQTTYKCRTALTVRGWDEDCFTYLSGDPSLLGGMWPDAYCSSPPGYGRSCLTSWYPSAWDEVEVLTIEGYTAVCESADNELRCLKYRGGDPTAHEFWRPDYICSLDRTTCWNA